MTGSVRNSATPVLRRALFVGVGLTMVFGVIVATIFGLLTGLPGVIGALLGAVIAAVFLGLTATSVLIAQKYDIVAFFAIVMGTWIVKFALFLVAVILLRDQTWLTPLALFLSLISGVIVSLVTDVVVVAKSRLPYASDVSLPGDNSAHR